MIKKELVWEITEEFLQDTDCFIVDILIQSGNRVNVFIDSDSQVTIKNCQVLSHKIEDRLNAISDNFDLIVSSAGLDRPLKLKRQFVKNIGRSLEVNTVKGEKVDGILSSVTDSEINIICTVKEKKKKEEKVNIHLTFLEIKSAMLKIDFKK
jgi:ribosome maturation factor RimP